MCNYFNHFKIIVQTCADFPRSSFIKLCPRRAYMTTGARPTPDARKLLYTSFSIVTVRNSNLHLAGMLTPVSIPLLFGPDQQEQTQEQQQDNDRGNLKLDKRA